MSVCNVSQSWQVGHVHSHCEYSLEVADGIHADVDLYIGLKSINITLQGPRQSLPLFRRAFLGRIGIARQDAAYCYRGFVECDVCLSIGHNHGLC